MCLNTKLGDRIAVEVNDRAAARKHYERGRQYELQDQLEEAQSAYEQACSLEPSFPEPYEAVGRLLALRGLFNEAIEHLDNALERGMMFKRVNGEATCLVACIDIVMHWTTICRFVISAILRSKSTLDGCC